MTDIICLTLGDFAVNTYIFSHKEGICVIDPADEADKIKKSVLSLQEKNPSLNADDICVFLTHGHLDHVGAVEDIKNEFPKAKICINIKDKSCLGSSSYDFQYQDFAKSGMGFFVSQMLPNKKDLPEADYFFSDSEFIFKDWQVMETPGHTKGSSCLYNAKDKILFSGDTLFWNSYGRTDLFGGNEIQMMESLQKLLSLPRDVKVFPGHGNYGFTIKELEF